jgi:hypothetical protein
MQGYTIKVYEIIVGENFSAHRSENPFIILSESEVWDVIDDETKKKEISNYCALLTIFAKKLLQKRQCPYKHCKLEIFKDNDIRASRVVDLATNMETDAPMFTYS